MFLAAHNSSVSKRLTKPFPLLYGIDYVTQFPSNLIKSKISTKFHKSITYDINDPDW